MIIDSIKEASGIDNLLLQVEEIIRLTGAPVSKSESKYYSDNGIDTKIGDDKIISWLNKDKIDPIKIGGGYLFNLSCVIQSKEDVKSSEIKATRVYSIKAIVSEWSGTT